MRGLAAVGSNSTIGTVCRSVVVEARKKLKMRKTLKTRRAAMETAVASTKLYRSAMETANQR